MSAPQKIIQLVERFERNIDSYKTPGEKEAGVRIEFINQFFKELGWDMDNDQGLAFNYKEVIHEDSINVRGATEAPDYAFRVGSERKFFLEAKHPHIKIEHDKNSVYQLKRYAWSQKLPLSILTDFEEFAVYDCRFKPNLNDSTSLGRIMLINYKQYPEKWDYIASIFSRDAVWKGSFDKYAEETKGKKGTTTVDDEFLIEIESWRKWLASNIALRNFKLTERQLNTVVQNTIDRLIFLRICEDRDIEEYGQLQKMLNGNNIYARIIEIYKKAEQKYNSGLFHFYEEKDRKETDTISLDLTIDDKPLKDIIKRLYYPESPYEFSVIPVEILGNVYERFLGKVISLTAGHQARIQDKPEYSKSERKSKGVYYTPKYIVDYIVENTVGKLLESKTIEDVSKLRILDPACGSGSFLLGAYRYLLDWHLNKYIEKPEKFIRVKNPPIYQYKTDEYKLTIKEKKRILLNNIYGVDIDEQAVEVTKLSLLLKTLESETGTSLTNQLQLIHDKALPDLSNNIKCGNSLIGNDIYNQQKIFNEVEINDINAYDWESKSGFYDIMKNGGFDAVIGNPPWVSLSGKFGNDILSPNELNYLIKKFDSNTYMPNIYEYFIAKGFRLTKIDGLFSFIVPDRFGFNSQFIKLRKNILMESKILNLLYKAKFPNVTADTLIFTVLKNGMNNKNHKIKIQEYGKESIDVEQDVFIKDDNHIFEYFENNSYMDLINKITNNKDTTSLSNISDSTSGYGGKSNLISIVQTKPNQIKTLKGDSIQRYKTLNNYWFEFKKENITGRTTDKEKLGYIPKILIRKTGNSFMATFDESGFFPEQSLYFLFNNKSNLDNKFLLGLINSKLLNFYYQNKLVTNKKSIAQIKKIDLDKLPIYNKPKEKAQHDRIVSLVEQMLELNKKVRTLQGHEKTVVERQIESTDKEIDKLVYELYALTDDEIIVVEGV